MSFVELILWQFLTFLPARWKFELCVTPCELRFCIYFFNAKFLLINDLSCLQPPERLEQSELHFFFLGSKPVVTLQGALTTTTKALHLKPGNGSKHWCWFVVTLVFSVSKHMKGATKVLMEVVKRLWFIMTFTAIVILVKHTQKETL